jgi:hypothetical protein
MKITHNAIQYNVDSVAALLTLAGEENQVTVVTDENQGGTFVYRADNALVNNGGTIFNGWTRQYDGNAKYTWFDTKSNAIISGLKLDFVSNVTINVPADTSTIQGALNIIGSIADDVYVTIQVADGTYAMTSSINLDHPNGSNIRLIGNETTASSCVLQVAGEPSFTMLVCSNSNKFGYINGFRINATTKATLANNHSGILAYNGAFIRCGADIEVNNFYYGINSSYNSTIVADYAKVSNAGDVGIWAFCGSFVSARYAYATDCADVVNGWGYGIQAEYGSNVNCEYAYTSGNNIAGIAALSNSQVRALNATASLNIGSGFLARDNSSIECHSGTASSNSRYGIEEYTSGRVFGNSITTSTNTLGNYAPVAQMDNTTLGARVISNNGDLRLDTAGANNIYFNTSGGLQFGVSHTASSVNRLQVTGASTGSSPVIQAAGSDSVIDVAILPKGAGSYVKLGAGYVATPSATIGYISVKDNTGTIRKLAVIS